MLVGCELSGWYLLFAGCALCSYSGLGSAWYWNNLLAVLICCLYQYVL